ncbi:MULTISPECIES: hypothetical protein [Arenibacter]|nr:MULTISPECIES: hypothetical protein [Arenibacter]
MESIRFFIVPVKSAMGYSRTEAATARVYVNGKLISNGAIDPPKLTVG